MSKKKKQIKNRFHSRRQFLIGSGQAMLFLPPLLSLMPAKLAAQVANQKKLRAVFFMGTNGIDPEHLYPSDLGSMTTAAAHATKYKLLSQFSSPISRMVDGSFSNMYPYMNLVEGLSLTGGLYQNHNRGLLAAVHTHSGEQRHHVIGRSADVILENSSGVYQPGENVLHKAIRITNSSDSNSFSYDASSGQQVVSSAVRGDTALFNTLFGNMPTTPPTAGPNQEQINKELVVDQIYDDLKKLENNPRISSSDRQVLNRYIASMFDLQSRIRSTTPPPTGCSAPNLNLEASSSTNRHQFPKDSGVNNVGQMMDNYNEMIRMAFACDLTRVVYIQSNLWTNQVIKPTDQGGTHHKCANSETAADRHQYGLKKMAKLAELLQSTSDPLNNGNLLDNSLIFWSNELGDWTTGHKTLNMPVVTFGKLGGFFKSGYYMDYRQNKTFSTPNRGSYFGRPIKQILQSIMLGMGVSRSEYMQYGDGSGFGEFKENTNKTSGAFTPYKNEHNDKLPFLT